jgi:hypothetical protein
MKWYIPFSVLILHKRWELPWAGGKMSSNVAIAEPKRISSRTTTHDLLRQESDCSPPRSMVHVRCCLRQ